MNGGYILGGTLLLCGAAIYRQRLNQVAQLAAIRPASAIDKVIADVEEKGQAAAASTAKALLPVARAVNDAKDFVSGLVGGPSIIDQINAAKERQKVVDAEISAAGGYVPWMRGNLAAGFSSVSSVRKGVS
jgi:hypothetical protein